jgi:protein-S-isoprenylcysteine O-methyltransferase Ste14
MLAALVAIAVFVVLAVLSVRWVQSDYASEGRLTVRSSVGLWLLYFFHADTVATAAYAGGLRLEAAPATAGYIAAVLVGVPGVVLFLAAGIALGASGVDGERLVTHGPYRLMRHPQNFGWGLMLLGVALAGRSLLAILLVGLFAAFVERSTRVEEGHLERRHGGVWRRYRVAVPIVPRLRRAIAGRSPGPA